MAEERLRAMTDDELATALRALAATIATPAAPAVDGVVLDPARRARLRLEADAARAAGRRLSRPVRRSLLLAAALLLAIAAVAGAIGLGLPGIRIFPAGTGPGPTDLRPTILPTPTGAPASPMVSPASSGPLGSDLGLGTPVPLADIGGLVDFSVRLPADPLVGLPAGAWLVEGRVSHVWAARADLPALEEPRLGLVLSQFRGSLDRGYLAKILNPGTTLTPVTVGGQAGWWLSGEPHELVYVGPSGEPVFDSHRFVGDALLWTRDGITYRLESGLGRDVTIRIAESMR